MRFLLTGAGALLVAVAASVVVPGQASAQIPNPGFETWTLGSPDGWVTSNVPGFVTPVTASNTRRNGSFSARGEVLFAFDLAWPAQLTSIFPFTQVPGRLQLYYQFAPQAQDMLVVSVILYGGNLPIASGVAEIESPAGAFTLLDLPVDPLFPGTPDSCYIFITAVGGGLEGGDPTVGTTFLIDDISLSGSPTSVAIDGNVPAEFALNQNYPNPFNPSTTIEYSLPEAGQVRLEVFNAIGERVAMLFDGSQDAGRYRTSFDASRLPSGMYLYRLTAGSYLSVKRMLLMK